MKVILTAFGGRLRSDIMEFPENVPDKITMAYPYERLSLYAGKEVAPLDGTSCYADFVNTGRGIQSGTSIAYEFALVDLQPPRKETT